MGERDQARQEVAEYDRWRLAHPKAQGKDFSDLAAIGAARYQPGVNYDQVAQLVHAALEHGRTWDEIADRLGMTAAQAKDTYSSPPDADTSAAGRQSTFGSVVSGLVRGLQRVLPGGVARSR